MQPEYQKIQFKQDYIWVYHAKKDCFIIDPYISYSGFKCAVRQFSRLVFDINAHLSVIQSYNEPNIQEALVKVPADSYILLDGAFGMWVLPSNKLHTVVPETACTHAPKSPVNTFNTWLFIATDVLPSYKGRRLAVKTELLQIPQAFNTASRFPFHTRVDPHNCPAKESIVPFYVNDKCVGFLSGITIYGMIDKRGSLSDTQFFKQLAHQRYVTSDWLDMLSGSIKVMGNTSGDTPAVTNKYLCTFDVDDVECELSYNDNGNIEDFDLEEALEAELESSVPKYWTYAVSASGEPDFEPDKVYPAYWDGFAGYGEPADYSDTGRISWSGDTSVCYSFKAVIPAKSPAEAARKAFNYIIDSDIPCNEDWSDIIKAEGIEYDNAITVSDILGNRYDFPLSKFMSKE